MVNLVSDKKVKDNSDSSNADEPACNKSGFELQDKKAQELLTDPKYQGKITLVYKATRAGCTFSLSKNAVRMKDGRKLKTVIIEPYKEIFKDVKKALEEANGTLAELKPNTEICLKLKDKLQGKKDTEKAPYYLLENCEKCEDIEEDKVKYFDKCELQQIVLKENWNVIVLTPQKLRALMRSAELNGKIAKRLLSLIYRCDILIIDEASLSLLSSLPKFELDLKFNSVASEEKDSEYKDIDSYSDYLETKLSLSQRIKDEEKRIQEKSVRLKRPLKQSTRLLLLNSIKQIADLFDEQRKNCRSPKVSVYFENPLSNGPKVPIRPPQVSVARKLGRNFHAVWAVLDSFKLAEDDQLWSLVDMMLSTSVFRITYFVKGKVNGKRRYHVIEPIYEKIYKNMLSTNLQFQRLIEKFSDKISKRSDEIVRSVLPDKRIFIVDASVPNLKWWLGALGTYLLKENIAEFEWGDPNNTNDKQLVICDSRKISKEEFASNGTIYNDHTAREHIYETINKICNTFGLSRVLVFALNKDIANVLIASASIEKKELPYGLEVSYFGSSITRGTTPFVGKDILVLVGGPYIPEGAFDSATLSEFDAYGTKEGRIPDKNVSEQYRDSYQQGSMVNVIGRVKDSKGERKSVVFALGISYGSMIMKFITGQCVKPPHIINFANATATSEMILRAGDIWLNSKGKKDEEAKPEDIGVLSVILAKTPKNGRWIKQTDIFEFSEDEQANNSKIKEIVDRNLQLLKAEGLQAIVYKKWYMFKRE